VNRRLPKDAQPRLLLVEPRFIMAAAMPIPSSAIVDGSGTDTGAEPSGFGLTKLSDSCLFRSTGGGDELFKPDGP
jgi:hypothetical protein